MQLIDKWRTAYKAAKELAIESGEPRLEAGKGIPVKDGRAWENWAFSHPGIEGCAKGDEDTLTDRERSDHLKALLNLVVDTIYK